MFKRKKKAKWEIVESYHPIDPDQLPIDITEKGVIIHVGRVREYLSPKEAHLMELVIRKTTLYGKMEDEDLEILARLSGTIKHREEMGLTNEKRGVDIEKEMEEIKNLIVPIPKLKGMLYLTIGIVSFGVLSIVALVFGTILDSPSLEKFGTWGASFLPIATMFFMIYSRESSGGFKNIPKWMHVVWWGAFLLNMGSAAKIVLEFVEKM